MNSSTQGGRRPPPIPGRARRSVRPIAPSNNAATPAASANAATQPQTSTQARSAGAVARNVFCETPVATAATEQVRARASSTETLTVEVHREVEAIVRAAVAQAVAPILREQRELEEDLHRELRDLRAQIERLAAGANAREATAPRAAPVTAAATVALAASPEAAAPPAPAPATVATAAAGRVAAAPPPLPARRSESFAIDQPKAGPNAEAIPAKAALDRDIDESWVLSGARRRRTISWIVGLATLLVVGGMVVAAVLSQLGYKI